uniref:Uncharacterized protein n=1 Tax=Cyprinus carpio TaxID=7962 RepID=A0A8C1ZCL7_CYPCA
MLLMAQGVRAMELLEFFFGLASATEVAYYSYIYSVVEPSHYQRVTGFCRSITLLGSAIGSLIGQILVSVAQVPMYYLSVITLVSSCIAFVAPWFLPMPNKSLFFHQRESSSQDDGALEPMNSSQLIEKPEDPE